VFLFQDRDPLDAPAVAPAARYFGRRHCHELTCTSCQEQDRRVSALRRKPELLNAILDNTRAAAPGQLILALKAIGPRVRCALADAGSWSARCPHECRLPPGREARSTGREG
jgi:hypothetical protein